MEEIDSSPLPESAQLPIIIAPLAIPLEMSQTAFDELTDFSELEIKEAFGQFLSNPPAMPPLERPVDLPFNVPFTSEEDFIIFSHLQKKDETLLQFVQRANGILNPIRTAKEIKERIDLMRISQNENLIDVFANQLLLEKLFYVSSTSEPEKLEELKKLRLKQNNLDQCRCAIDISPKGPISPKANEVIDNLHSMLDLVAKSKFQNGELAMLRGEDCFFMIKQAAVLLGRNGDKNEVDIDLSYNSDPHCNHISRNQAILYLLNDFNFYIENIGVRGFRVNGVIIPTGAVCKLPNGALLDFSASLFIFIANTEFIDLLKAEAGF